MVVCYFVSVLIIFSNHTCANVTSMIVERPTSGLTFESSCCYYWYDYIYNLDGNLANTVTDSTGRHTILILQLEKTIAI